MGKLAYWERLLCEFLESCSDKEFKWGEWDCVHFARESERAIYGDSTMDGLDESHQYHDLRSMIRLLANQNCVDVFEFISLHKKQIPVNFVQRGDWVGVLATTGHTIGVWDGRHIWVPSERGLIAMPLSSGEMAWKVR